jgi:hypothetical protein
LFYTANDEGDGSKNIECIVPFYQEDMIWLRYTIRCLTTMTKSYGPLIAKLGHSIPKPWEVYQLITENAAGGIKED